jgi:hypothetical protein
MLVRNSTSGYKIGLAMDDQMHRSERVGDDYKLI